MISRVRFAVTLHEQHSGLTSSKPLVVVVYFSSGTAVATDPPSRRVLSAVDRCDHAPSALGCHERLESWSRVHGEK